MVFTFQIADDICLNNIGKIEKSRSHRLTYLLIDIFLLHIHQSQYPDVNDAELKLMESQILMMSQKLKESSDVSRQLDTGM